MAPSSRHTKIKHDVFISFRGTDVRRGLLSHLIKELRRGQIDAYVDDRLERGDEISSALVRAIEESQILLVIFSKDFASSKWCLDELVKMMECMERNNMERNRQIVVPVFYNVDPSYVRNQKEDYGIALAKPEKMEDIVKVQNWRFAIEKAAQLSGFHYPSNFENESDLVDEIVKDVSNKLSKLCSSESKDPSELNGLVGIDQNIAWIRSSLTTESREVLMLGIWGMGGIGKTTIARKVFDIFSPQYEGCCFLENVRDDLKDRLRDLREMLVSKLLEEEDPHINGRGKANYTKRRLSRMKVLIVLDDVDTPNLLKDFLEPICFGPGSRVIVTSRDKQVFAAGGFHEIHKVKELNFEESLKLFCINAFNESQPKMGYEELSKKAVAIAKGIPLALNVFGSYFQSKSKGTWECALEKLRKYPDRNIQRVLRLSYDGLDDLEKKVFLDIAFFFKEEDKDYVLRQMDAWHFHGTCGIEALQEKALITISYDNRIQMHDLIQEMGWEIVRQESIDPRRRSRLRDAEDVYDVLNNNKGSDLVEGMLLDVSQIGVVALNVDSLKRMPNLRILKFYSPLSIEVSMWMRHFVPEDLENVKGSVRDILKPFANVLKLSKLANNNECDEVLMTNKVSGSKQLMALPNLDVGSTLKELMSLGSEIHIKSHHYRVMEGCSVSKDFSVLAKEIRPLNSTDTRMETLNSSIGLLSIHECSDSVTKGLQHENVGPKESSVLPDQMRQLNSTDTRMELLNSSKEHFSSLECSEIDDLQLGTLPKEVIILRSTYYHKLRNCREQDARKPKLQVLFDGFSFSKRMPGDSIKLSVSINASVLEEPDFDMKSFYGSIKRLQRLKKLSLRRCRFVQSIELPPSIQKLEANNCLSLRTVAFSSNTVASLELEHVDISFQNCRSLDAKKFSCSFHQYAWELALASRTICVTVCYPGSKVPEWFTYCTRGASLTVEFDSPLNDPFSCLLCLVLSPSSYPLTVQVECQSYCNDGNMPRYATKKCFPHEFQKDLNSDHICIWYLDRHFLREIVEGIVNDQCTSSSYDPKVTFQVSFEVQAHSNMPKQETDGLIKGCGICPLYLRDYHKVVKKIKRCRNMSLHLEIDLIRNGVGSWGDQEPLPPTKKLKRLV